MKEVVAKFKGHVRNQFHFETEDGQLFIVDKCRRDLIDEFNLLEPNCNNRTWLLIKYFEVLSKIGYEDESSIIISEISKRKRNL